VIAITFATGCCNPPSAFKVNHYPVFT
jgi:hypothetical protein